MQLMGMEEKLFSKSPFSLSGGEKRRVAIAGVLAMRPRVLFLDEPAAGLDATGKTELEECLLRLQTEEGLTLVQTSHSMEDAAQYAKRVIVLHEGRILRDGPAEEVFQETDSLERIGLAAPRSLYLLRRLREKGIPVKGQGITLSQAAEEILRCWKEAGHVS
jgi:energy-coupling factor transport system ATP-binding protein